MKRLIKSGRGGKKLLTYLNKLIRPIIGFDGKNQLLSVSATLNGAINKMVKLVVKELAHQKDAIQSLVLMKCSETNEQIEVMKAKLVSALEIAPEQIQILSAPSVIACHTGLETFGIGVQLK